MEMTNRRVLGKNLFPVVEKVLVEGRVLCMIGLEQSCVEASNLLRLGWKVNGVS